MKNEYICHMYGNFSKANMDTQTSSHMLLKNNSTEALNQILFPAREREIFEHLVFYYILLYCGIIMEPFLQLFLNSDPQMRGKSCSN